MLRSVTCLVKPGSGEEGKGNERGEGEKGKQEGGEERANERRTDTSERFEGRRDNREEQSGSLVGLAGDSSLSRSFLAFYANHDVSCARLPA